MKYMKQSKYQSFKKGKYSVWYVFANSGEYVVEFMELIHNQTLISMH